jgi:hypothetical protein
MVNRKLVVIAGLIFLAAFMAGSFAQPSTRARVRALEARMHAMRGPKFPDGDTLAIADTLFARCGTFDKTKKEQCYGPQVLALREQRGTRFAMGSLHRLIALDRDVAFTGHDYAHMIGIKTFQASGDFSSSFKSCTEILQSGCYHGVIQTYLMSFPNVGAPEVTAACREYTAANADRWLRFQCVHGMGHGLTMFYDHDLPRALKGCDLLAEEWDQKSCYGGAFMENIVFATDPSMANMVMHKDDDGMHMNMPMDAHGAPPAKFKMIDHADPNFPCSVLGERYQNDCWQMQPAVMLYLFEGDWQKTFDACDKAPEAWRPECYQGLGTSISGGTIQDHDDAIRLCSRGSARYQPWCYEGVVKNFIDVTAKSEDGISFCKVVPGRANRLKCYASVGEEIAVLRNSLDDRKPMCDVITGDADGRDACLFGAQLTTEAPRGLPVAR